MANTPKLVSANADTKDFDWRLQGRLVAIDSGGRLAGRSAFPELMKPGAFAVIAFDPSGRLANKPELESLDEFQLVSGAALGDGQTTSLYACLSEQMSSTLSPLAQGSSAQTTLEGMSNGVSGGQVLAELPIGTVRLDSIEGLGSVDWLLLDDLNDNLKILQNGEETLRDVLLVQVRVPFAPTHQGQTDMGAVSQWMAAHGFEFYRFQDVHFITQFSGELELEKNQATQMKSAELIFVPTRKRMASLERERAVKLAFLLHTVYEVHDLAYEILSKVNQELANEYLVANGYLWPVDHSETRFTLTVDYCPDMWD